MMSHFYEKQTRNLSQLYSALKAFGSFKFLLAIVAGLLFLSFTNPFVLTVEIMDIKNSKGEIALELSDAEKNFVKGVSAVIKDNACTIVVDSLAPGNYTFRYFHDENNNKELDTNIIGIPKEGFGFSNVDKISFGPPSGKKMIFEINKDTTIISIPQYLGK